LQELGISRTPQDLRAASVLDIYVVVLPSKGVWFRKFDSTMNISPVKEAA
jgi:hypothetical protein